jgi:2-polyprenyl-3-methyl-5-hydroxy-6-metoxy-1,4-benzoquinol methylase
MSDTLQPTNRGAFNPDLLARIPLTAKAVLELGCGDGALGARFKAFNPDVHWSGIERRPGAAARAVTQLDAVLARDLETLSDAELDAFVGGTPPDVLVFADVLQHLRDPLAALKRLVQRLAPGGAVVASVPNAGHWSVVQGLLQGRWSYGADAAPGSSDLRVFTLDSAAQLLREAGLTVMKLSGREIPLAAAEQAAFLAAVKPVLPAVAGDAEAAEKRLKTLQYVLVAQKPPVEQLIVLHQLVMVRDLMEARIGPPWAALNTLPAVSSSTSEKVFSRAKVPAGAPRVAVIQRQLVGDLEGWRGFMRRLIGDGWVTVAEWDDHPDLLPEPAHANFLRHPWMTMSGVHACQVSTPLLAEAFRQHNPEVAVFENALPELPPLRQKDPSTIRIVYAAVARPGVARLISAALDAAGRDPRVEIVVMGDDKVFACTRSTRKAYRPLGSYGDYMALLESADIALLPLKGLPSELYKSPLKFMECASRGALCIASPHLYENAIEHGRTGWIARSPEEFTTYLLRAIVDADERRTMAQAAWDVVRERHLIAHGLQRKIDWYRHIASRRTELTAQLLERHPELRP